MEDIQSWWELPSIAHFCSLFRAAFDLLDFDIEELEEAILTDGLDRSGSPLLVELLVRLLQGCLPGKSITPSNVDSYLRKLFRQKCQEDPTKQNLFTEGEFRHLPLRRKVEVLHALCDFRLEADDVLDLLKNLETESLRVEPLGYDDRGSTFWYFYGTRLYREDNSLYHPFRRRPREKEKDKEDKRKKKRKKKGAKDSSADEDESILEPTWQVQCYTEEDWSKLSKQFEECESKLEKSLLQTLQDDFLPEIPRLFEEKEKIQQRRMMEFAPRRSSGRVQKLKEKKEEEEKRLAVELAAQEKKRIQEEEKRRIQEEEERRKEEEIIRLHEREIEEEEKAEIKEFLEDVSKKRLQDEKNRIKEVLLKKKKKIRESSLSEEQRMEEVDDEMVEEEVFKKVILDEKSKVDEHPKKKKSLDSSLHSENEEEEEEDRDERKFLYEDLSKKKYLEEKSKIKQAKKIRKSRESEEEVETVNKKKLFDDKNKLKEQTKKKRKSRSFSEDMVEEEDEVDVDVDSQMERTDRKKSTEEKVKAKKQVKKKKKNHELNMSKEQKDRLFDRDEDVLHERNTPYELIAKEEESLRQRHNHNHKEKKPHHRKHHKRNHHKNNHHIRDASEPMSPDNQIVSDTSNKENHFDVESSGDEEETIAQPQVYSGRKTNNSLSSLAFSLTPSSVVPEPASQMVTSPVNKKRVKSAHMLLQTEDDLKTGMYKVLEHLREHEDAWPFLDPVDETFAPNYYAVIRRPMYITKMESRLDSGYYTILSMFEADFKLMMDNCKLYNGPESEYTHMAYTLEKIFAKLKTKYLETEFSSDEEIYIDLSFQQASKRKNKKRNSTEEKESKIIEEGLDKPKKGKKKKKVGRKPKIKTLEETIAIEKVDKRLKANKPPKERGRKRKNKAKDDNMDESRLSDDEMDIKEDKKDMNGDINDEDDDDDDDDYNEPLLLVREDPYPEDEENDDFNERLSPLPISNEDNEVSNSSFSFTKSDRSIKEDFRISNKWKKEPDKPIVSSVVEIDEPTEREKISSPKPKKEEKTKCLKGKNPDISKMKSNKDKKTKKLKDKKLTKKEDTENKFKTSFETSVTRTSTSTTMDVSDSDSDRDHDGFLLYYNNDEGNSSSEDEKGKSRSEYLSERHNELFGEIDDIEEEEIESENGRGNVNQEGEEGDKQLTQSTKKIKKKEKAINLKDRRKHKHHHHHHHKSKSKVLKHHHHKKTKSNSGNESPSKKVLKVEEVYEYSEDDPNSRDSKDKDKDVKEAPFIPSSIQADKDHIPLLLHEDPVIPELTKDPSPIKKKKNRRKGKHGKHLKRKEGKEKVKGGKKTSKRKCIKKIIKKKRKQIPVQKMAAIDALSAATEQTLKDITCLLDDPEVPRFKVESPSNCSPADRVTAQEFETIALKIEAEYRRKLKLEPSEDKKPHKKKKRKIYEEIVNEQEPKKKKVKKEKVNENKENDKKVEKDRERRNSETSSLDNTKELFKDIKDGRIKPGAIIKSKDIAKKEGVVKKESKPPAEPKPKSKQNPFGKINKQENSKLTTLIAKAKESRIGLVPNSEVGDSPKLSLGSIILFGDIGTNKQSAREPNSADDEDKMSDKFPEKVEKWDSPWENRWEKPIEPKEEISNPPSQQTEEEEEKEEIDEQLKEVSPVRPVEELQPPPTPRAPEFRQEKATPNLSAWFRAFGGPKLTAAPRNRMDDDEDRTDEDVEFYDEEGEDLKNKEENEEIDVEETNDDCKEKKEEEEPEEIHVNSPESVPEERAPSPRPPSNHSVECPVSPQPPPSPEKPPETPWYDKLSNKTEEEPIWKNNKIEEEEDPYKFEEEELDRAREEAKKLEVERQRKASVSSSGLSDPSPLNIDSDRSPAAFSSEGERSPLTRSPATKSPVTPGFGGAKQYSPVTEKSPSVPAYSPRYETGLGKSYSTFEDKAKYQANGTLKVGFYQDMTDKASQEKKETPKVPEQKVKESPIYSPTVPYVSPLYSSKDQNLIKQKSPGRYSSYYSSLDSSALDKPKTPGYYSTSAPSTPTDMPSPAAPPIAPPEEKPKAQYNYYNYDPTKSLTDQYKNTGGNSKPFYSNSETNTTNKTSDNSPLNCNTTMSRGIHSPAQMNLQTKPQAVTEKPELQPPKKRQAMERAAHQQSLISAEQSSNCTSRLTSSWNEKHRELLEAERNISTPLRNPYTTHPLPADLANLSQIVSRIPEPESISSIGEKESVRMGHESHHLQPVITRTVHPPHHSESSAIHIQPSSVPDFPQNHSLSSRSSDLSRSIDPNPLSDLSHQNIGLLSKASRLHPPPAAHQKIIEGERPGSRNMPPPPHAGEKSHGYLHQKTMWSSNLPSSIPVSLSSLVSNATMAASIALAGQKGLGSFPLEHLAQFGMDRATLASLASQGGSQLFPHDLLARGPTSQSPVNPPMASPTGLSMQTHLNHNGTSNNVGPSSGSNQSHSHSHSHSHSRSSSSLSNTSVQSGSSSSSGIGSVNSGSNNFDLGLSRSYASMISASQSSPLFARSDPSLTPGSLPRSLSGSPSPFLSQSPGLSGALGMTGSSRTPTPAHQQSLSQSNFPSIARDPRDPISQSHPSLQIPSLNSINQIACSQAQTLSQLNAANLAFSSRDSLALMNQGGRGPLVGVEPTPQQLYYLQRHQIAQAAAQEDFLLRSAGHPSLAAHQQMMLQQGLMPAAAGSYPTGYPHSLGLRSGSYQGMNRPWI